MTLHLGPSEARVEPCDSVLTWGKGIVYGTKRIAGCGTTNTSRPLQQRKRRSLFTPHVCVIVAAIIIVVVVANVEFVVILHAGHVLIPIGNTITTVSTAV